MNLLIRFLVTLLLLVPFSSFADRFERLKVINVISGVPQPSDDGPGKSGGFGDVAANFVSSIELKRRYPQKKVFFLVTSAFKRYDPLVPTSDEIIKIMAPELDPTRKSVVQVYKGVEVIFLPLDFYDLLREPKKHSKFIQDWIYDALMAAKVKKAISDLSRIVPHADLGLNFSHYPDAGPVMRVNNSIMIGAEEHYGAKSLVTSLLPPGLEDTQGTFLEVPSGPRAMGFMFTGTTATQRESRELIRSWARKTGHELPEGDFNIAMSYTMEWQAAQAYIYALSELKPKGKWVLFTKSFPNLDLQLLPPNIQVVQFKAMPNEVMRTLIDSSTISPMLTGDISLGHGLSTVKDNEADPKILLYEAPPWKVESAAHLRGAVARDVGMAPRELKGFVLTNESLERAWPSDLRRLGREIATLLQNKPLVRRIARAIINRRTRWDIIDNCLQLAETLLEKGTAPLPQERKYLQEAVDKVLPYLSGGFDPNEFIDFEGTDENDGTKKAICSVLSGA